MSMNLIPYTKIILHVCDCDVNSGSDVATVVSDMHELMLDLIPKCDVIVSGLLPMGGFDIKPFNVAIKQLCSEYDVEYDVEFIDHHDSFIMASGYIPNTLFCADKVSLRPMGTASLISNIDSVCKILRKHDGSETPLRPRMPRNVRNSLSDPICA